MTPIVTQGDREPVTGGESPGEDYQGDQDFYGQDLEELEEGTAEEVLEAVGYAAIDNLDHIESAVEEYDGDAANAIKGQLQRIRSDHLNDIEALRQDRDAADEAARAIGEMLYDHVQASAELVDMYSGISEGIRELENFELDADTERRWSGDNELTSLAAESNRKTKRIVGDDYESARLLSSTGSQCATSPRSSSEDTSETDREMDDVEAALEGDQVHLQVDQVDVDKATVESVEDNSVEDSPWYKFWK